MTRRSVVVTGMGIVSPLGNDVEEFWRALSSGTSGITTLDGVMGMIPPGIGGRVRFDAEVEAPVVACASRAAMSAWNAAGLEGFHGDPRRVGVAIGANLRTPAIEGLARVVCRARRSASAGLAGRAFAAATGEDARSMEGIFPHAAACRVARRHRARGPCLSPVGACAAGSLAILSALRCVEQGQADVMVAGGSGVNLEPLTVTGYALLGILTSAEQGPERSSRPFDRACDGQVLSDGAAVVVLEELAHAERRGATPLARLTGYGCSAEARPLATPDRSGAGAARAMSRALADSGPSSDRIDYVCAHAVGIRDVDAGEVNAIKTVFGARATDLSVSSIKSMIGNPVAAGGVMQLITSVLALRHGCVPPTINLEDPDPDSGLDCTPNRPVARPIRAAMSNTLAFGGQNTVIVIERLDGGP